MKVQHATKVAGAGIVVALVLLQFARWVPMNVQSALFVTLGLLALAMIVMGWRRWIGLRQDLNLASWRKKLGLLALVADTLALIFPFMAFFYAFASFHYRHRPSMIVWALVPISVILAFCGLICGILAPPRLRFMAAMGGLIVGSLIVSVPIGVL